MTPLRNSYPRSAATLLAAAWLVVVALCPPMFRMDCLVSGRTAVSWYTPVTCAPQKGMPAEHSVSPQCCEFSKIAPANNAYEPLLVAKYTPVLIVIPVILAMEPLLPRLDSPLSSYKGHGPPQLVALDAQADLGVFRI